MAATSDPVQLAFETSIREFKKKLKDEKLYSEILQTTTIDHVYDMTDKLQDEQAKKGHMRYLSRIEPFLDRLRGYTSSIETFVQAKPEILALIWGPVKLLLQWTSVLKQSFDQLVTTIADIGDLLPEFKNVVELFHHNRYIKDVLALFFQDMLDIYIIALNFFSLSRWKAVFEMMWPKQREKIQIAMVHIKRHTFLMRNEVRLEHIREEHKARCKAMEHYEKAERSDRRQEYNTIKGAIAPRTYEAEYYAICGRICKGTGKWLMKDATFIQWLKGPAKPSKPVWLQGIPGAGKTYLVSTVVEQALLHGRALFAFLNYQHTSSTTALSIIHSLMFQLAAFDDDLESILCQSAANELRRDLVIATELLKTLLGTAGVVFIIVDGLDEIEELERTRLLRCLLEISDSCSNTRILVSSRIEDDINSTLRNKVIEIRIDHRNAESIQAFLNRQVQEWFLSRDFVQEARTEILELLAPVSSKAKGMFLYVRVVLNTIEDLDDMAAIRDELKVLPDSLDDAYQRILNRINCLHPPALKEKARKLLGWVGCSSLPLQIQEIEQALTISTTNIEHSARVMAKLNIVRICGPILEIVNSHVQFVHFTAKEYIFSPRNAGYVDLSDATFSLMSCCIEYLCETHHDFDLTEEELCENLRSGLYRLHEYSINMWMKLVQHYLDLVNPAKPPKDVLTLLQRLIEERSNDAFVVDTVLSPRQSRSWRLFQTDYPDIYQMLCSTTHFHKRCFEGEYDKQDAEETSWNTLDPLTITRTSARLHHEFNQLLCDGNGRHQQLCHCIPLQRHYGERPFKCSFLGCSYNRYGFSKKLDRDSHLRHHKRSWKCGRADCQYSDGFLSRKMRDQHWERHHQEEQRTNSLQEKLDEDELQPLLFDVVREDRVEMAIDLLPQLPKINDSEAIRKKLLYLAAGCASMAMIYLIQPDIESWYALPDEREFNPSHWSKPMTKVLTAAIEGNNIEVFRHLLFACNGQRVYSSVILDILKSSNEDFHMDWEVCIQAEFDFWTQDKTSKYPSSSVPFSARFTKNHVVKAVSGDSVNELFLLSIWKKLDLPKDMNQTYLGDALVHVAATCCSVKLARYLLDAGAKVDHRRNTKYLTPLHHAAMHNTQEAAELMKFLLCSGADPAVSATSWSSGQQKTRYLKDEVGAQYISTWLEVSWEDLIRETGTDRSVVDVEKSGTGDDTYAPQAH